MIKLKKSSCDENSKTPNCNTKQQNWNCDETQKFKLWPNSKTQMMTKLKNANCDKTQKPQLWQNLKTHVLTKTQIVKNSNYDKNWNYDKTQIVTHLIMIDLCSTVFRPMSRQCRPINLIFNQHIESWL